MNSLEKLIADLKDTKMILDHRHYAKMSEYPDEKDHTAENQQDHFIEVTLQGAINRLEALNEELERGE
jgi:hypothetical protein